MDGWGRGSDGGSSRWVPECHAEMALVISYFVVYCFNHDAIVYYFNHDAGSSSTSTTRAGSRPSPAMVTADLRPGWGKELKGADGQTCQICGDTIGISATSNVFVAYNECAFPVCRPCYEYERKDGVLQGVAVLLNCRGKAAGWQRYQEPNPTSKIEAYL